MFLLISANIQWAIHVLDTQPSFTFPDKTNFRGVWLVVRNTLGLEQIRYSQCCKAHTKVSTSFSQGVYAFSGAGGLGRHVPQGGVLHHGLAEELHPGCGQLQKAKGQKVALVRDMIALEPELRLATAHGRLIVVWDPIPIPCLPLTTDTRGKLALHNF